MSDLSLLMDPPLGDPPVVMTADFSSWPDRAAGLGEIRDGAMRLCAPAGIARTQTITDQTFRDVIVEALVSSAGRGVGGIIVRHEDADGWIGFSIGSGARMEIAAMIGGDHTVLAGGALVTPFDEVGWNLLSVVALGPSLTFLVNREVVTALTLPVGRSGGMVGVHVRGSVEAPDAPSDPDGPDVASVACRWLQVRAVLPVS